MNNLADRLMVALKRSGKRKTDIWRACGISSGAVTFWFNGETQELTGTNLAITATLLGVNAEWLATGKGAMEIKPQLHSVETGMNMTSDEVVIEQHHDVSGSMGTGLLLRDLPGQITGWRVTSEWANKNIPSNTGKQNLCIVTGFGDSMRGMFNSGDPLLVDTGVRELQFDGVYFFRIGTEGFIKRLQRIPGDGIRAISKNADYEAWTISPEMDFEIFGRVVKVWKSEDL